MRANGENILLLEVMTKKNQNPVFKTIKEYAENTTIHGIQYIFENGASVYEKFSWIFVVLGGAIFAAILSLQGLQKWQNNLILTTVETTSYPIEKVEFPSITICAQVGYYQFLKFSFLNHRTISGHESRNC